jgi:hypothetical protein
MNNDAPPPPKEKPFKELRFTRSRQAVTFVIAGVLFLCLAAGLGIILWWRWHSWLTLLWLLLPLAAAWGCLRLALHLTRHAYLLLSPIGIEIFPFLRPAQHMQLFSWGEIGHAEVAEGDRLLVLTLAGYQDSKVIISLDPVPLRARPLLRKAVEGLMEKRARAAEGAADEGKPPMDENRHK